jgi:caa(3)-type oxidase subunit IV
MVDAHSTAEAHSHPTPGTYAKIGLFLFVLTALEVGLYEGTYGEHAGALGASLQPFFIPLLLFLSAIKFALVAMFYMHLKDDSKLFSGVFVFPIIIATVIILGLVALQLYHWSFAASG